MKKADIKIDPKKDLQGISLFVGTPMYGGVCSGNYTSSLIKLTNLFKEIGVDLQHYFIFNESLIPRARNYVVDTFMRSHCTHMIFIDADIGFDPIDVLTLLWISVKTGDDSVIGAVYPKKAIAWEKIKLAVESKIFENNIELLNLSQADFVLNLPKDAKTIEIDTVSEAKHIGTGFMLMSKKLLSIYKDTYKDYNYIPDHVRTKEFDGSREITLFFHSEIDEKTRRYLSEDYWFCEKVSDMGKKILFCPWMSENLSHAGTHTYRGSLSVLGSINANHSK